MEYDGAAKHMQRATLVALYKRTPNKPIIYLDGATGEATTAFVNIWHVPVEFLVPVNIDVSVIDAIETVFGVVGRVGDINLILSQFYDNAASVVWLDYMCCFNPDLHIQVLRQALKVAPYASITFSTRGRAKDAIHQIMHKVKHISKMVENVTPFQGKSGIQNMVKFTIARNVERNVKRNVERNVERNAERNVERNVAFCKGSKTSVIYGRGVLTAVVLDIVQDRLHVQFDCDGKTKWVARHRASANKDVIDMTPMLGTVIAAPVSIFPRKLKGHSNTKKTKRSLFFQIGKRHHRGAKYTVHAVMKNGDVHKKAETWLITPEQAVSWHCP